MKLFKKNFYSILLALQLVVLFLVTPAKASERLFDPNRLVVTFVDVSGFWTCIECGKLRIKYLAEGPEEKNERLFDYTTAGRTLEIFDKVKEANLIIQVARNKEKKIKIDFHALDLEFKPTFPRYDFSSILIITNQDN